MSEEPEVPEDVPKPKADRVKPDNQYMDALPEIIAGVGAALTAASVVGRAAIEKRADVRQAEIEAETKRLESAAETERTVIREAAETERERLRQQTTGEPPTVG